MRARFGMRTDTSDREVEHLLGGGAFPVELLADGSETDGQFCIMRWTVDAGQGPHIHTHQYEDESIFVLSGALRVEIGPAEREVQARGFVVMPRGTPHRFVTIERTEMLTIFSPAGFEQFLRERDQHFRAHGHVDEQTLDHLRTAHRERMATKLR
jgi:quercetin dioxygenase-like cupin family protein